MAKNITSIPGVSKFKDLRNSLTKHKTLKYDTRSLSKITHIAIHHSASATTSTPYDFAKWHVQDNGWPGIGYHFCISSDGTVSWVNNLETISYNVGSNNAYLVGVELTGNFDKVKPTDAQLKASYALVKYLQKELSIPANKVLGHKEFPGQSTACPGKNLNMATFRTKITTSTSSSGVFGMPSSSQYTGPSKGALGQTNLKDRLAGTDKYNDLIFKVAKQKGVNPVLVKVIMAIETAGDISLVSSMGAKGLMQVMPKYYPNYDYKKMSTNAEYSIAAGCDVIKEKAKAGNASIHDTAWRYYGKLSSSHKNYATSKSYGDQAVQMYNGLGFKASSDNALATPAGSGSGGSVGDGTGGQEADAIMPDQPMMGTSPSVEDDEYPAHRLAGNPFSLRIGDSQFFIPPTSISVTNDTSIDESTTIRQRTGSQTKSGFNLRKINLRLVFGDLNQINGYSIKGPDGQTYYMDGLRAIVAQAMKNPFLPIRNEFLNYNHNIFNVAIEGINVATLDDYDDALVADLSLIECTVEPYIQYPDQYYDRLFMYPLFRWWYQQLLHKDRNKAYSGVYLRPIENDGMNGQLAFRTLDRDLIEKELGDLEKSEAGQIKLGRMKWADIDSTFMTDWPIGEPIIQKVEVQFTKDLVPLRMDDQAVPAFQDMGGYHLSANIQMICSREEVEALNEMTMTLEELSRDFRHRFVSGFAKVGNEILNMMGIYHVMIEGMSTMTMENEEIDEAFLVALRLRSFEPTQKNNERLNGINSYFKDIGKYDKALMEPIIQKKSDMKNHELIYESNMELALELLELYPDLELPSYDTINKVIPKINKLRSDNGYQPLPMTSLKKPVGGNFVEPDFYFAYPTMKSVIDSMELDNLGQKYLNLFTTGSYEDIAAQHREVDISGLLNGYEKDLVENWKDEESLGLTEITGGKDVSLKNAGALHYQKAGRAWNEETNAVPDPVEHSQELAELMCHDMVRYGKAGRMVRAFPTYLLLFIDEGLWMDGRRLWDNYYSYHAVSEINVVRDKNSPVDLAYVQLSNIYGAFNTQSRIHSPDNTTESKNMAQRFKSLWDDIWMGWTEKQMGERTKLLEHAKLMQGARVHIRMGYGGSAMGLPTVFNGHIAEVTEGQEISIVCQSDGVELINQDISFDPNATTDTEGFKNESRNIFRAILGRRYSDFFYMASDAKSFFNNYESKYGIEHFGYVESKHSEGFFASLNDFKNYVIDGWFDTQDDAAAVNVYDVMKNVYRGSKKAYTDEKFWADGEYNIELSVYNKTPWDIFQTLAAFNPEFICGIHHHGFRSTVFFGMPHWMVKYGYRFKADLGIGKGTDRTKLSNYVELTKPYQQMNMIASTADIIHNNMKASSEHIKHIAVGVYVKGSGHDVATTFGVYADRSIKKSAMKTTMIDTGVSQNYWGPDWLYNVLGQATVGQFMGGVGDLLELTGEALVWLDDLPVIPGDLLDSLGKKLDGYADTYRSWVDPERIFDNGSVTARDVAIGSLHRVFMEMYQGEIITLGKPELKPWDLFYLADTHNGFAGTAQVGKITLMMSKQSGFTTAIKPDLSVARSDGLERNAFYQLISFVGIALSTQLIRKILASNVAKRVGRYSMKATAATANAGGRVAGKIAKKTFKNPPKTAALGWDKVKGGFNKANDFFKDIKFMKKMTTVIKSNLVLATVLGFLTLQVEKIMKKEMMFNNCLYIYPIWKHGRPFTAGIQGAKYIIPNYIDPQYAPEELGDDLFDDGITSGGGATSTVVHPVPDTRGVSSWYGARSGGHHYGVDIRSRGTGGNIDGHLSTNIRAIADGKVIVSGFSSTAGNWVQILHNIKGKDIVSVYMHLHKAASVKVGAKVKANQVIGIMGNTGASEGVHLHIEICEGKTRVRDPGAGNRVNPKSWFEKQGINLNSPS